MDKDHIHEEIFSEFEQLADYDRSVVQSYVIAKDFLGIPFEDKVTLSDKWGNSLVDKKLNDAINVKLDSGAPINWKEVESIYNWSSIKNHRKEVIDPWQKEWEKARKMLHTVFFDPSVASAYFIDRYYEGALTCPKCNCPKIYECFTLRSTGRFKCSHCNRNFSLTSNTLLRNTNLSFITWYSIVYLLTSEHGEKMTTSGLARSVGITQTTAWRMCKKIRSNIGSEFLRKMNKGLFEYKGGIIYQTS